MQVANLPARTFPPYSRHQHRAPVRGVSHQQPSRRPQRGRQARCAGQGGFVSWQAYEAAKRAWIAAHPGATPEQYDAAMRAIAERLGI